MRIRVRELELSAEQQQQAGRDQLSGSHKPVSDSSQDELKRSSAHDVKTWKLKVRLGEEKIKELEKDVEKKVKDYFLYTCNLLATITFECRVMGHFSGITQNLGQVLHK